MLTHGSLFAGIGGFDEGFRRAGMKVSWQVEIELFCRAVLRTKFPESELFNDVRECGKSNLRAVDVLTAGFPCQDLSVAGKRAGLAGTRSGLFWEVVRILGELRPPWFVLENVPGLFSSNNGEDFRVVLESLDELGYGLAWRVLDSQFFGVAQRRRRVFIVGCFGKPCPTEVLFESEGGEGDFAESGETWERVAASGETWERVAAETCDRIASPIRHNDGGSDGGGPRGGSGENLVAISYHENKSGHLAAAAHARALRSGASHSYQFAIRLAQTSSNGWGISEDGRTHTLDGTGGDAVLASLSGLGSGGPDDNDGQAGRIISSPTDTNRVRAFTGLPLGMDSARYRALGNAVTAKVAEWIGRRIIEAVSGDSGRDPVVTSSGDAS